MFWVLRADTIVDCLLLQVTVSYDVLRKAVADGRLSKPESVPKKKRTCGQPVFKVNTVVDPGLLTVLEEQIVPQLLEDVPNQPSEEQLKDDPYLSRFRLVFDREGYSPGFFKRMWEKRIACQTYRKGSYEPWAEEEFVATEVKLKTGQIVQWKLAERGVRIGSKKTEMIWVREVRKLTEKGHQTAILPWRNNDERNFA